MGAATSEFFDDSDPPVAAKAVATKNVPVGKPAPVGKPVPRGGDALLGALNELNSRFNRVEAFASSATSVLSDRLETMDTRLAQLEKFAEGMKTEMADLKAGQRASQQRDKQLARALDARFDFLDRVVALKPPAAVSSSIEEDEEEEEAASPRADVAEEEGAGEEGKKTVRRQRM